MGVDHVTVVHAVLWTFLVTEGSVALQDIRRSRNLCNVAFATTLLAGGWNDYPSQRTNPLGFLAVPAEVQG